MPLDRVSGRSMSVAASAWSCAVMTVVAHRAHSYELCRSWGAAGHGLVDKGCGAFLCSISQNGCIPFFGSRTIAVRFLPFLIGLHLAPVRNAPGTVSASYCACACSDSWAAVVTSVSYSKSPSFPFRAFCLKYLFCRRAFPPFCRRTLGPMYSGNNSAERFIFAHFRYVWLVSVQSVSA